MIAIIGALSPLNGGTTVSLSEYKEFLENDSRFVFFDTANLKIVNLSKYIELFLVITRSKVASFHVSDRAAVCMLPILYLIARLFRTKVCYRQFGGEFSETYKELGVFWRWIVDQTILKSDYIYFQSKYLVEFFSKICADKVIIRWLPTSRINRYSGFEDWEEKELIDIVFLGRVVKEKGIYELIESVRQVEGFFLNVYGPCNDLKILSKLRNSEYCKYHGELERVHVAEMMKKRGVFALPSYHPGEGYSGAVVEATFCGLPLILTKWNAFPEMFSENEVMFVSPKSVDCIVKKLITLKEEPNLLIDFSKKSFEASKRFDLRHTIQQFIDDHLLCAEY